ncbi:D site-binding protein-like [Patiria miniata]|uniref:BZIP domain-containing protein n=1 Tax=Patiria miniata TaxID=46514 RepID=A0A914A3C2_PATMI|nr:D site-binding protein-like [Patiria miniata]
MACRGIEEEETVGSRGPVVNPVEIISTGLSKDTSVIFGHQAPGTAQRASMPMSSLFNHGDPDLSFCDVLAAYPIETESDQPPTVDVEGFTDLMLFPDLMGVLEENLPGSFQDLPLDPMGGVGEPFKPRDVISSVSDGGEISPAESDASVDHFFNTFTDLTGFLQQLTEETGPTDLNDLATSIAGSNDPLMTDAEPSAMATTTLPTPVGSETACKEEECSPRRPAPSSDDDDDDDEAPPTKKARTSRHNASAKSAKQKYRQRRDKNNIASQRSRATRKQREGEMVVKAKELEAENARLRVRIDELTVIAEEARKCLVVSLSQK